MTVYSSYSDVVSALTLAAGRPAIHPRLFLLQPEVVFAARVVLLDPAEYPISFVAYDTVTVGAYTDIKPGMTILLGSTAGGDQYGRQRVRGPDTAATAISIFVGRSSRGISDGELTLVNDAYITVLDDRRVWAKIPFIDADGGIFKDSDLEVEWRTTTPPPVANMGEGDARTINPDTLVTTVSFNGQPSYATADGATITDYLWDIADGTLTSGTLADDNITATFPAGFRYVSLTVTDSNGKTATTERPVYARDPDNDTSFDGFAIESHRITDAGQQMTIRILEDMPRATYPDGTLAMIWDAEPEGSFNRGHMLIVGWIDSEDTNHSAGRTGLLRDTTITIQDVAARLDTLPGFPQSVADDETRDTDKIPDITWSYMIAPTMDKYIHYLLAWHSTALEVTDFYWSDTGDDYQVAIKSSDGESLWNQVARTAQAMIPGFVLTCEQAGRIYVKPDPMLQDSADRTSTVQATITEDNWSDIRFTYQRAPKTHWLRTGALIVQDTITFNDDGTVHLPTVFSIAPGDTPGQGLGEVDNNEGLVASQDILNSATGHRYARMNNPVGMVTVTLVQDDQTGTIQAPWREIEPALKEWVTLRLGADYAAQRGLTFDTVRCLPKEINIRYNQDKTGLTRTVEVTLEVETEGVAAATVIKPDVPVVGEQPPVVPAPIPPPDMGLIGGQDLVAGIGQFKVYRTSDFTTPSGSGGPTWDAVDLTGSDEILTWVVDPFSPGYIDGAGSIDGFLATATKLYRVRDLFGTPVVTTLVTFADTAQWRTIQASFGTYFVTGSNPWLICVSYYGSSGGTKATYSVDGGVTWAAEVVVSAEYDSGGASNPIGLYCSPKTPGLAYTVAHTETANPAATSGYVSRDWGATWTEMPATEDPANPLPDFGMFLAETHSGGTPPMTFDGNFYRLSRKNFSVALVHHGGTVDNNFYEPFIAPPANTKRITVSGTYVATNDYAGFGSSASLFYALSTGANVTRTVISNSTSGSPSANHSTYTVDFVHQYDFTHWATDDWPGNRDTAEASGGSLTVSDVNIIYRIQLASTSDDSTTTAGLTLRVDEIVLDDGTTYTPVMPGVIVPVHGQGGEIHLPWEDNADESIFYYGSLDRSGSPVVGLQRAEAGTVTDISPAAGYGINHGHFAVRAHDSDRQLLLACVTDGSNRAVYKSTDAGDTWSSIIASESGSDPYSAAWSGSLDDVLYIWGPAQYISFSDDAGATLDDRSGNLSALSATKWVGLAGGPPP